MMSRCRAENSSIKTRICLFEMRFGECAICGRSGYMDIHHVFGGTARQMSEKYGATVMLCPDCHRSYHAHPAAYRWLREKTQAKVMFMQNWDLDEWMAHFHKNYL